MNDKKVLKMSSAVSFGIKKLYSELFLIIVFVSSARSTKKQPESQVNSTISYVKTQYSIYARRYNDATETKATCEL